MSIVDRLRTQAQMVANQGYKTISWELQQLARELEAGEKDYAAMCQGLIKERDLQIRRAAKQQFRAEQAEYESFHLHNKAVRQAAHIEALDGNYWGWQDDEESNHLESLACPVVIPSEDLRRILKERDDLKDEVARADASMSIENCRSSG